MWLNKIEVFIILSDLHSVTYKYFVIALAHHHFFKSEKQDNNLK